MSNRTLIVAITAVAAVVLGVALSFFELIILGIVGVIFSVVLALRGRPTRAAPGR